MSEDNKVQFTLSQSTRSSTPVKRRLPLHRKYFKELRERSLNIPCCLLIIYAVAIASANELTHRIIDGFATNPEMGSTIDTQSSTPVYYTMGYVRSFIHLTLYISMGWVSDIKLGRARAVGLSLWSSWLGVLLEMISSCIQFGTSGLPVNIAKYGLSSLSLLFLLFGSATFFVNIIAYGLDQLVDESSTRIRAFLHWSVWGLFIGFTTGYIGAVRESFYNPKLSLITGVAIFVVNTLAVSINNIYSMSFKPSGILNENPYKLVADVLRYAYRHKHMRNRSAFTYWEDEIPNRISMAKQKYGGPFTSEAVESVKTFLRIIVICLAIFGFYVPFFVNYRHIEVNQFKGSTETLGGYGSYIMWSICDKIVIILVPLYEVIFVPLFPKVEYFFLNPLRWLGISYVLLCLSLLSSFALGIAGELVTPYNVDCTSHTTEKFNISFLYFIIPLSLYGLADMISIIYGLEFIGSQAPSNMSGMLTGIFWFVRGIYTDIGRTITVSFSYITDGPGNLSCNFWLLLTQLIICVCGFLIYIKVARWYQNRIRNDQNNRAIVEEKFIRRLTSAREGETQLGYTENNNNEILEDYVVETLGPPT